MSIPRASPLAKAGVASAHQPHEKPGVHHPKRQERELVDDGKVKRPDADPLDPETRRFAQLAPPSFGPTPSVAPAASVDEVAPRARVSMEELLPQLVKRIAWAGDKRRGSVQMELGSGPHAGTVVTVHADDGKVRVELQGDDSGALRQRLEARGFNVER